MKYILLILISGLLAGCIEKSDVVKHDNFIIKTIDGCEYIEFTYMAGNQNGLYSLTHKGDCNNPIHIYRKEK